MPGQLRPLVPTLSLVLIAGCGGGASPPAQYKTGGTIAGLAGKGLVLQDNGGNDLAITANGTFSFAGASTAGTAYTVNVKTQPVSPSQTCTVNNASGVVSSADTTTVVVTCTTNTYTVGGTTSGLIGSGLVLQNNGGDDLAVSADGSFTFATSLSSGTALP